MWDHSSQARVRTHTPCSGVWSLNHWTTKEIPQSDFNCCGRGAQRVSGGREVVIRNI